MRKKYRLEFISKRPGALKAAWQQLLRSSALTSNLGVLTGSFEEGSPELREVLSRFDRDKVALDVRMESSCVVVYDRSDIESHSLFKFYPQEVEVTCGTKRTKNQCSECGRNVGADGTGLLTFDEDAIIPCAVAMSSDGDLFIHRDLVEQIFVRNDSSEYRFEYIKSRKLEESWLIVRHAPMALRIGRRAGFCATCGGAVACDLLPDVDETYLIDDNQEFVLSPDLPALPCFSKQLASWLISTCSEITWSQFKPISRGRAVQSD